MAQKECPVKPVVEDGNSSDSCEAMVESKLNEVGKHAKQIDELRQSTSQQKEAVEEVDKVVKAQRTKLQHLKDGASSTKGKLEEVESTLQRIEEEVKRLRKDGTQTSVEVKSIASKQHSAKVCSTILSFLHSPFVLD